ncbi:hypothetical protein [uncultured Mediterranean phage uvMED]|nr:hypothetical protein [uncultured Mediterranean phage uvMED]
MKYKVVNMESSQGNKVPNQYIIDTPGKLIFQSYKTIIVMKDYQNEKIYLDKNAWNYSATTSKYRNIFLGESLNETLKKIENKEYILTNLN